MGGGARLKNDDPLACYHVPAESGLGIASTAAGFFIAWKKLEEARPLCFGERADSNIRSKEISWIDLSSM